MATNSFGGRALAQTLAGEYLQGISVKKGVDVARRYPLRHGPLWETDHKHLETVPGLEFCQAPPLDSIYGCIIFGFPIQRNDSDRTADLLNVPAGVNMLFVTGSKDEKGAHAAKIAQLLPQLKCAATCSLHVVEGGKHNPLDGAKADALDELQNVIQVFIDNCVASSLKN